MKEITVPATPDSVKTVTEFVNEQLDAMCCPLPVRTQIDIAVDEAFSNIARYAYSPEEGPATVHMDVTGEPPGAVITFIDHGKPYDPLSNKAPDITAPVEDRPIGGLGIFLVRKTMDDVSYEYRNGQNILRIKKKM